MSPSRGGVPTDSDSTTIRSPAFPCIAASRRSNSDNIYPGRRRRPNGLIGRAGVDRNERRTSLSGKDGRVARIEGYRFGRVEVDGREHTRDLIVLPDRVIAEWWRTDGHALVLDD